MLSGLLATFLSRGCSTNWGSFFSCYDMACDFLASHIHKSLFMLFGKALQSSEKVECDLHVLLLRSYSISMFYRIQTFRKNGIVYFSSLGAFIISMKML